MIEKSKIAIKTMRDEIRALERKITEEADKSMKAEDVSIPSTNMDGTETEGMNDDAQWFYISDSWDCPGSPFGLCMYHIIHDGAHDTCVFCGDPEERK